MSSEDQAEGHKPTEKEAVFFFTVLNSNRGPLDVDWDLVAERLGLTSANSAKTRFGQIKKSLGSPIGATTTPKKPRAQVGSGTNKTPSKVTKPRVKKSPVTPKEDTKADSGNDYGLEAENQELGFSDEAVNGYFTGNEDLEEV